MSRKKHGRKAWAYALRGFDETCSDTCCRERPDTDSEDPWVKTGPDGSPLDILKMACYEAMQCHPICLFRFRNPRAKKFSQCVDEYVFFLVVESLCSTASKALERFKAKTECWIHRRAAPKRADNFCQRLFSMRWCSPGFSVGHHFDHARYIARRQNLYQSSMTSSSSS